MSLLSNACMPNCIINANPDVLIDVQYDDFDEQAQQLVGYDQSYIQLTSGAFSGRFLSCFLGRNVAVHVEQCNQALEQSVIGNSDSFSVAVAINKKDQFRPNGQSLSFEDVLFLPPKANFHIYSPVNGAILAVVVQKEFLLNHAGMSNRALDFLTDTLENIRLIHAPQLAARIREDVVQAIESSSQDHCSFENAAIIGDALVTGITAKLSLELSGLKDLNASEFDYSYERFVEGRASIYSNWNYIHDLDSLLRRCDASKRSLQQAFKTQVETGPLAYHRIIRLHLARRALLDPRFTGQSIGDVAAIHGFWNWSQFTSHYRNHFGELPSQTRMSTGLTNCSGPPLR